eukprot:3673790-Prorocentrum_lima.AAC.1
MPDDGLTFTPHNARQRILKEFYPSTVDEDISCEVQQHERDSACALCVACAPRTRMCVFVCVRTS